MNPVTTPTFKTRILNVKIKMVFGNKHRESYTFGFRTLECSSLVGSDLYTDCGFWKIILT